MLAMTITPISAANNSENTDPFATSDIMTDSAYRVYENWIPATKILNYRSQALECISPYGSVVKLMPSWHIEVNHV